MKLTDLAIISLLFFICILVVIHMKSDVLYNQTFNMVMYNKVMDNMTEEALSIGYEGVDMSGKPIVSLEKIVKYFKDTEDVYSVMSSHLMCYVDMDGFYMCASYGDYTWSDKIYFSQYQDTLHEQKLNELINKVKGEYGIDMTLPYNNGEKWGNSVEDFSLIVISFEKSMGVYCFSGAKIHKK